ncbi:hypothetical protein GUJ93_ZPchr0013g37751 [Zizania palustris]|uniref:Uncharacterized protein n=1 Tax=Zizania palustris TaxID=103762 RepID=A0A8J5WVM7_ZIZPA|nr:hypothetical protein GUJ93_ZPchr0013g37751 [Zizania palustris]
MMVAMARTEVACAGGEWRPERSRDVVEEEAREDWWTSGVGSSCGHAQRPGSEKWLCKGVAVSGGKTGRDG